MDIWIVLTKSKVLPGCPLPSDGSEYMYGRSAISAENETKAIAAISEAFKAQVRLVVEDVLKTVIYRAEDWEDGSEQSVAVIDAFKECQQTGDLAFGMFISTDR